MVPRTDAAPSTPSPLPAPSAPVHRDPVSSFRALAGGLTPLDSVSASRHLAAGYQTVTGSPPSQQALELLWAQWALETNRGQAMYGNNFGGIKAGASGPSALLHTREGYGAHERRVRDRFRTYATAAEGARDYVSLLARRYPAAFEALRAGDVDGFATGLHRGRYFTAHPDTYRTALRRLADEHRIGPTSAPPPGPVESLALDGLRWALEKARED
jgi:hypothetical protein